MALSMAVRTWPESLPYTVEDRGADPWWRLFGSRRDDKTMAKSVVPLSGRGTKCPETDTDGGTGPTATNIVPLYDVTQYQATGITRLEFAAAVGDEALFIQEMQCVDSSQWTDNEWARVVHLALTAGAYLVAQTLASTGAQRFPRHTELQRMSHVLAPPKVLDSQLPAEPSLDASLRWLQVHAAEYTGLWVAVKEGQFLACASTLRELTAQMTDRVGILVTKVV